MNKLWLAASLVLLLLCASSCNLYRRLAGGRNVVPAADSGLHTVKRSAAILLPDTLSLSQDSIALGRAADTAATASLQEWSPLWNPRDTFSTFSGKAKVHYENATESQDVTATIRIARDSQIWMSVTVFGGTIEFLRARVTPDSVFIIDRLHRELRAMMLSEAGTLLALPANFGALQSILLGSPLALGIPLQQARLAKDTLSMSGSLGDASQELRYSKSDTLLREQKLINSTAAVALSYTDYRPAGGRSFARQRRMDLFQDSNATHSSVTLDFSRAAFNEPVEMPFDIPQKYERK